MAKSNPYVIRRKVGRPMSNAPWTIIVSVLEHRARQQVAATQGNINLSQALTFG